MQVLFRAKEKNSNNYVVGYEYYNHVEDEYYITHYVSGSNYKIDRTTRSINIENMLDSQGNKIFASLQKNGRGGDICESKWFNTDVRLTVETESVRYSNSTMIQDGYNISRYEYKKIIGIQQWNQIQYKKNF